MSPAVLYSVCLQSSHTVDFTPSPGLYGWAERAWQTFKRQFNVDLQPGGATHYFCTREWRPLYLHQLLTLKSLCPSWPPVNSQRCNEDCGYFLSMDILLVIWHLVSLGCGFTSRFLFCPSQEIYTFLKKITQLSQIRYTEQNYSHNNRKK